MPRPTLKKPSIKYIAKSRKGLPIYMWVKTWFEYNERASQWTQRQEWTKEKPE